MMNLNPNNFYHNGGASGKLTSKLRNVDKDGVEGLRALLTALEAVAVEDGTVGTLATALGTVNTELATAATFNICVESY